MRCSAAIKNALGAATGLVLALALVLSSADCTPAICSRNSDCPTGLVCGASGSCTIAPDASDVATDGGTAPTTGTDASTVDAGTTDAALADAAAMRSPGMSPDGSPGTSAGSSPDASGLSRGSADDPLPCVPHGAWPPGRCHEGGTSPP
jgi:hypothetical protein